MASSCRALDVWRCSCSLRGCVALEPTHCEALTNRGDLLERFGRLDEALACFDAIDTIRPDSSSNLFNKGSVLQKLGRHKEALAAYEEAARRGPPDAETNSIEAMSFKARAPRRSARCL